MPLESTNEQTTNRADNVRFMHHEDRLLTGVVVKTGFN
jgi:hypothetical protein